jgi:hypothetical protein
MNNITGIFMGTLAATALIAGPAAAQSSLVAPAPEQGIWLEASRPHFKDLEVTIPTSIWFLGGRMVLNEQFRLIADVPLAHAGFDGAGALGSETSTVIGNPYLGVEYVAIPRVSLELGLRAPLTTADETSMADAIGFLAEPQRGEAFIQDAVPISAAVTLDQPVADAASLRARVGFTSAFYTGDDDEETTSTFTDYGVFGNYAVGIARFGAGISGRWHTSADEGSFTDNSIHQLALTADAKVGRVRPGVSLRVPLDETHRNVMDYSVGLYLQVPLR